MWYIYDKVNAENITRHICLICKNTASLTLCRVFLRRQMIAFEP